MTEHDQDARTERAARATTWLVLGFLVMLVVGALTLRCEPAMGRAYPSRRLPPEPPPRLLPAPEMDDEYVPCSDCHEDEPTNRTPRELEDEHDDLKLAHGDLWCLSCHDVDDRDQLRLAEQVPVPLEESLRLCAQCHGEKLADWRAGIHGKRTGHWWGPKDYQPCLTCHDPHAPRFQPLLPEPPPARPTEARWGGRPEETPDATH